ncbi:hypothetical protein ACFPYI_14780 [Halomarina salina]|uniref:Uncharacterized protein n=1 Tax=Halomarina salina TaxID=1872699 RepID=A0ABD5RQA4_9EURY|nr:hypothetical protein [Halomarina salina]
MTDDSQPIHDQDGLRTRLTDLLDEAEKNGIDVAGSYECETTTHRSLYDVQVNPVRR